MTEHAPFRILWIEDDLYELKDGVKRVEELLREQLNRPVAIAEALCLDDAYAGVAGMKDSPPDIVILDIMLPRTKEDFGASPRVVDLNAGFLFWRRLRHRYGGSPIGRVPVLVLSALGMPEFRVTMEADRYGLKWLMKPVAPSKIVEEIRVFLSRCREAHITEEKQ